MSLVVPQFPLWRSGHAISSFNGVHRPPLLPSHPPRAALVEAKPRAAPPVNSATSLRTQFVLPADRTDDLQAEARAMARAADAPIYSPELLANTYGSRPIEVLF